MVTFPPDETTPQQRVDKIFQIMDKVRTSHSPPSFPLRAPLPVLQDGDGLISAEDFLSGAKKDPSILKALSLYEGLHM